MNILIKSLSAITLGLSAVTAFASPAYLITHNNTDVESNAFVAGTPSLYPSLPNSTQKVYWNLVKLACYGHVVGGRCAAVIKMETNTPSPVEIGTVSMDLATGDIIPKQLSAYGYTLNVNGPGETTITKD